MGAIQPNRNVRIVSDGTCEGTHLLDEDGNEILKAHLKAVTWEAGRPNHCPPTVTVTLIDVEIDVIGKPQGV